MRSLALNMSCSAIPSLELCEASTGGRLVRGLVAACVGMVTPLSAQDGAPKVAQVTFQPPSPADRYTVFISDLHFGVGKNPDGKWNSTEDFRWTKALRGFVEKISEEGSNRTDLVVVGDFLELWQPPPTIPCKGAQRGLGLQHRRNGSVVEAGGGARTIWQF